MKIVAVIPVKEKSERVMSKNFKTFADNLSLFELKLKQLVASKAFEAIYISTNALEAKAIAEKHESIIILDRNDHYCNNITPWSEVIHEVVCSIPEEDDTVIAWCHVTSPLFSDYDKAIEAYKKGVINYYNGLVTVSSLSEFIVSERARPVNYNWGVWHEYSQNLNKLYAISGALFVATKGEMKKNRYVISTNPILYEVSEYESIDIDTPYDFKIAQLMYANADRLKEV